jgi:hypothetical protein
MDLVESLISEFEVCPSFCENTPSAGWESHIRTIQLRERFHSVVDTVDDDEFSIVLIGVTLRSADRCCDDWVHPRPSARQPTLLTVLFFVSVEIDLLALVNVRLKRRCARFGHAISGMRE